MLSIAAALHIASREKQADEMVIHIDEPPPDFDPPKPQGMKAQFTRTKVKKTHFNISKNKSESLKRLLRK